MAFPQYIDFTAHSISAGSSLFTIFPPYSSAEEDDILLLWVAIPESSLLDGALLPGWNWGGDLGETAEGTYYWKRVSAGEAGGSSSLVLDFSDITVSTGLVVCTLWRGSYAIDPFAEFPNLSSLSAPLDDPLSGQSMTIGSSGVVGSDILSVSMVVLSDGSFGVADSGSYSELQTAVPFGRSIQIYSTVEYQSAGSTGGVPTYSTSEGDAYAWRLAFAMNGAAPSTPPSSVLTSTVAFVEDTVAVGETWHAEGDLVISAAAVDNLLFTVEERSAALGDSISITTSPGYTTTMPEEGVTLGPFDIPTASIHFTITGTASAAATPAYLKMGLTADNADPIYLINDSITFTEGGGGEECSNRVDFPPMVVGGLPELEEMGYLSYIPAEGDPSVAGDPSPGWVEVIDGGPNRFFLASASYEPGGALLTEAHIHIKGTVKVTEDDPGSATPPYREAVGVGFYAEPTPGSGTSPVLALFPVMNTTLVSYPGSTSVDLGAYFSDPYTLPAGSYSRILVFIECITEWPPDITDYSPDTTDYSGAEWNVYDFEAWLCDVNEGGGTTPPTNPAVGPMGVRIPNTEWESARAAHVWLTPQRVNLVANPSFEPATYPFSGVDSGSIYSEPPDGEATWSHFFWGWRTNSEDIDNETSNVVGPAPRGTALYIAGTSPTTVLESNYFPVAPSDGWFSVEAAIAGSGRVRIGIVFFDMTGVVGSYDHSGWMNVDGDAYRSLRCLIPKADRCESALFRLEFSGESLLVDNVMVDTNAAQLGYFDGAWYTGRPGDFSWYDLPNRSFSTFYADRRNVDTHLFGYNDQGAKDGKLYQLRLASVDTPRPEIVLDENTTIRDARDLLLSTSELSAVVQRGGEDIGQVSINDLTTPVRHRGLVWDQVPQGAQVIPQWDNIYGYIVPCWPGDLKIRTFDYAGIHKTNVTQL